uniref:Uncharacterized protein n=1 Tax=Lepeophtheirus salmonis TaxID=72036 RepID=A0A0K2UPN0_LEPSM
MTFQFRNEKISFIFEQLKLATQPYNPRRYFLRNFGNSFYRAQNFTSLL